MTFVLAYIPFIGAFVSGAFAVILALGSEGTQTALMFGAGIKGGQAIGASDEFGYKAQEQPISYHDLHTTMLHLLGLDHTKLTYRFNGRDMRLTDVYGTLIPQIVNA